LAVPNTARDKPGPKSNQRAQAGAKGDRAKDKQQQGSKVPPRDRAKDKPEDKCQTTELRGSGLGLAGFWPVGRAVGGGCR